MGKKDKARKSEENEKQTGKTEKNTKKSCSTGKKILKITAWTFGSVFAFLLLLIVFRDPVIKFGVTSIGSWITGVDITIEEFDTSIFKGSANIKGLRVGNPAGFEKPNMLELEEFNADIDVASLFTKEIVIEDLRIAGLNVTAEFNRQSKFNVTTLTGNLKRRFPPEAEDDNSNDDDDDESAAPAEKDETPDPDKPSILFQNIDVAIKLSLVHDLSRATLSMPISYSENDLRIAPDDDEPLVIKLDALAQHFENFCQACFNAGAFVISAGSEAGESLKTGVNSGIDAGKKVFNSGVNTGKKVFDSGVDTGKSIFDSAKKLFK